MLVHIANAQARMGATVAVVVVNNLYDRSLRASFHAAVRVVCLHREPFSRNPAFILRLNRELRRIHPDAIHLHSSKLYGLILDRNLRRRTCLTLHDMPHTSGRHAEWLRRLLPLSEYRQPGNVAFIDRIPTVFAISRAVRERLLNDFGRESIVVANGIRTSGFAVRPLRKPCKDRFRIVQISRLMHVKKGQDLLIEAVSRLGGHAEVDFVGDGGSLDYLKRLAEARGVGKQVRFLGKRSPQWIGRHLCGYDLLVQPSRYEGFGLTVAEAMAARVPVLVSAGQGPAEITCEGRFGWLFRNGSAADLLRALRFVLSRYDEALRKAEEAARHVQRTYDVAVTARKYLNEYKRHEKPQAPCG